MSLICLGIDPGLASTGWGLVEVRSRKLRYLAHGCISTKSDEELGSRIRCIHSGIGSVLRDYQPGQVAMESLYFSKNITSAMYVAEAKGVIRLACTHEGLEIREYSPLAIKQSIVGSGRAEKSQVQDFVKLLLGLSDIPKPNHAADALGVAICHIHHLSLT